jgi:poly-gamma-glutamate synthesis protein (capsule biosynthesis protein)
LITEADLRRFAAMPPDKPRFAFLHWGQEFADTPGPREQALAARLAAGGVELVIGSHPHRAGALTGDRQQCLAYSLGNFIFDQRRPQVSGALLEVMFYPQGTYFLRLHSLGNLYEENFYARQDAAPFHQGTAPRLPGWGPEIKTLPE